MKKASSLLLILCSLVACKPNIDLEKEKQSVLQADKDFSNLSVEKGMNSAFISYCAEEGVLLRPNSMPIEGKTKIADLFNKRDDKKIKLTWSPLYADVAQSGEMAYTYGSWLYESVDSTGNKISQEGTYATVWKKDAKGNWKWVLDTGNDGLGKK